MKTKLFTLILFCCSLQLFAQTNPLVGTWKVVSITGTDGDGKKITYDGSQFVETKIITPNHYSLITQIKEGDSLVFNKAIVGTVRTEGNKYIETPLYSSNGANSKVEFTYKVDGDKFIQAGTGMNPDGKKTSYEITFQKVKETPSNNPAIGTWNQLTSSGVDADGKKWSHTNATHLRFLVITPTHYMFFREIDNKFEDAFGGTYKIQGNKFIPILEMDSKGREQANLEITQKVEGGKLHMDGKLINAEGTYTWKDVYERVDTKNASNK